MNNTQEPLFGAQVFGFEFEVYETPRGYLLAWSDYVANSFTEGYETLPEVFWMLEKIAKEANK
jgi:hypothetical protein